jgi:hypothetical protein
MCSDDHILERPDPAEVPSLSAVDEGGHDLLLRLRPLPYRSNEPSVACRVRSLLKAALRAHRLRCVAVQVIKKAAAGGGEGDQA